MKILITTDWYVPAINGVVTSVLNLKRQLEERGCQVRILTLAQGENNRKWFCRGGGRRGDVWYLSSCGVGKLYPGARVVMETGRQIISEIAAWKPDIVHSQCEFTTFPFAKKIAALSGARLIHTYHTVYEDYTHYFSPNRTAGRAAVAAFSRCVLRNADQVIAPTEKVKRLLTEYGVDTPIAIVPSGIDCAMFEQAHTGAVSKALDAPILVTVGRLAKEKNLEEIFGWLACGRGKRYRLLVVGDGPYRDTLTENAKKLGIAERVFFAGMVEPEEVAAWYQKGRIFVSASTSETQGLTYLEALAGGIPAVCRKDSCLDGVIQNGVNGWQYRNQEEFFGALEWLERPDTYRAASRQAMETARHFDRECFGDKILEVYRECRKKEAAAWSLWQRQRKQFG